MGVKPCGIPSRISWIDGNVTLADRTSPCVRVETAQRLGAAGPFFVNGVPPPGSRGRQVLPPLHRCKLANSFASVNAVSGCGTARAELAGQLKRPRQLERRWTGHCVQVDTGLRCRTRAGSLASRRRSRQHGRRRGTGGSHMKLRLSIDTILLAAVLLAAVPVGSLHAAEAPRD